jgi:hypothetical protein
MAQQNFFWCIARTGQVWYVMCYHTIDTVFSKYTCTLMKNMLQIFCLQILQWECCSIYARIWEIIPKSMNMTGKCFNTYTGIYEKKANFQSQQLGIRYSKELTRKRSRRRQWTVIQSLVFTEYLNKLMCHMWRYRKLLIVMIDIHFTSRLFRPLSLMFTLHAWKYATGSFRMISPFLEFCLWTRWYEGGNNGHGYSHCFLQTWCRVTDCISGPFILEHHLSAEGHLCLYEIHLPELLEDVPHEVRRNMQLQHCGAPVNSVRY